MAPLTIRDDLGQTLSFKGLPQRIVSLIPSLTETLVRLGARERLAGRTEYCIHPAREVENIPTVGGTKNPSVEAILALEPDCVVANAEENEKKHVDELKKHTQVFVTFPRSVEGAIKTVEDLGALAGAAGSAASWAAECRRSRAEIAGRLSSAQSGPAGGPQPPRARLRTVCFVWRDPWMAAGADTYMSDLLATCGFENVFSGGGARYPVTTIEAVIAREPHVVLLPDEPYKFERAHKEEIARLFSEASLSPRILLADGAGLAWYGWRTLGALAYVASLRERLEA